MLVSKTLPGLMSTRIWILLVTFLICFSYFTVGEVNEEQDHTKVIKEFHVSIPAEDPVERDLTLRPRLKAKQNELQKLKDPKLAFFVLLFNAAVLVLTVTASNLKEQISNLLNDNREVELATQEATPFIRPTQSTFSSSFQRLDEADRRARLGFLKFLLYFFAFNNC